MTRPGDTLKIDDSTEDLIMRLVATLVVCVHLEKRVLTQDDLSKSVADLVSVSLQKAKAYIDGHRPSLEEKLGFQIHWRTLSIELLRFTD